MLSTQTVALHQSCLTHNVLQAVRFPIRANEINFPKSCAHYLLRYINCYKIHAITRLYSDPLGAVVFFFDRRGKCFCRILCPRINTKVCLHMQSHNSSSRIYHARRKDRPVVVVQSKRSENFLTLRKTFGVFRQYFAAVDNCSKEIYIVEVSC
ncbi:hypothetical protein Tcan_00938, partial [Toxocara canis]